MDIFASAPIFGKLRIVNVYLDFDGPKIFYAENESGSTFFVYWIGDDEAYDSWYVIPCSKSKIIAFEKKKINLRSVLEKQEQEYFYDVKLPRSLAYELKVEFTHRNKVAEIILPEADVFVRNVTIYAPSLLKNGLISTHELVVSKTNKRSKTNISLEHMSQVCDRFSELVHGFNSAHKISGGIQALNARYGSFAISLHADELTKFEMFLSEVSSWMINKKDITSLLVSNDIDIKVFLNFLKSIESSSVDFELRSAAEPEKNIKLYRLDAEVYLSRLKYRAMTYISSIKVPQGNDIEKVFQYVDLKWKHEPVTGEALNVHDRIVDYYKHAVLILGFMEYNGELTPLGQRVALSDEQAKYRITVNAFESSECIWAWMNYSDVTNLNDLDMATASDFLSECCPSLSGDTIPRRANALISWWKQLIPYHVGLKNNAQDS